MMMMRRRRRRKRRRRRRRRRRRSRGMPKLRLSACVLITFASPSV
jgi:hypothetical protein